MARKPAPSSNRNALWIGLTGFVLIFSLLLSFRSTGFPPGLSPAPKVPKSAKVVLKPVTAKPPVIPSPAPRSVPAAAPTSVPPGKGKIAIVLDDWGYSTKQIPALQSIQPPLTISILPNLPHSAEVARAAHARGHHVILHMPMEAQDPHAPREAETILTSMSPKDILQRLDQSFKSVPYAEGMNNHQGSKATSNRVVMGVVLKDLKRRGLYYVDSWVTDQSVGYDVAQKLKLRSARRDLFLDNQSDPVLIREQVMKLARAASKHGYAIGIGHDRPHTLQVLQAAVPELEQAGYTIVPASDLAN